MNNDELKEYFNKLMPENGGISDKDIEVFRKLTSLTLDYRNKLDAEKGEKLTVGEVRVAIELYWMALEKNVRPTTSELKIEGLIRLWLKEINNLTYE